MFTLYRVGPNRSVVTSLLGSRTKHQYTKTHSLKYLTFKLNERTHCDNNEFTSHKFNINKPGIIVQISYFAKFQLLMMTEFFEIEARPSVLNIIISVNTKKEESAGK